MFQNTSFVFINTKSCSKIWLCLRNQDVTQDVTQGVTQGKDLDAWIERQVAVYPQISTEELAAQSGLTSRTIKRHIIKMPHIVYVGSGYSGHWEVKKKQE